jgi:hypothetical protein
MKLEETYKCAENTKVQMAQRGARVTCVPRTQAPAQTHSWAFRPSTTKYECITRLCVLYLRVLQDMVPWQIGDNEGPSVGKQGLCPSTNRETEAEDADLCTHVGH